MAKKKIRRMKVRGKKVKRKEVRREEIIELREKTKLSNTSIVELLNENFIKKLKSLKNEAIVPISLILFGGTNKKMAIMLLSHESPKDYKKKILSISSSDETFLEKIKNIIKNM